MCYLFLYLSFVCLYGYVYLYRYLHPHLYPHLHLYLCLCLCTSKEVSVTELPVEVIVLLQHLAVLYEKHAVSRRILLDDDIALLVHLVVQPLHDANDHIFVFVPEQWHVPEQAATHHCQDLLGKKSPKGNCLVV